jgi:hypothetical protein
MALSASEDRTLRLWDVASGHEVARFYADAPLHCPAFSPCEWRVVAGDAGGAVHFLSVLGVEDQPAPADARKRDGRRTWWPFRRRDIGDK